jgi:hypothetical protein
MRRKLPKRRKRLKKKQRRRKLKQRKKQNYITKTSISLSISPSHGYNKAALGKSIHIQINTKV